jgi:hypothetical protein
MSRGKLSRVLTYKAERRYLKQPSKSMLTYKRTQGSCLTHLTAVQINKKLLVDTILEGDFKRKKN